MKTIAFITLFFLSLSAFAKPENPQIRACNLTYGEFHVIAVAGDQFGYCQYDSALMDSMSIMLAIAAMEKTQAVKAYEDTGSSPVTGCDDVHATLVSGSDVDGAQFEICLFGDKSSIELATLKAGKNDSANTALTQALWTRVR